MSLVPDAAPQDGDDTASWGRQAPFTMAPDWVALSAATNTAKTLFWHISMHVNQARGDAAAWPGRAVLARRLGLSRPDKADRYIKELLALGAIEKTERKRADGSNFTNHYVVHQTPPPGYTGARDLTEAYAMEKAAAEKKAQVRGGPPKEVPPGPQTGAPPTPNGAPPGPPNGGPNKTKNNKKNENPPPSEGEGAPASGRTTAPPTNEQDTIDGGPATQPPPKKVRKRAVPWPGEFSPDAGLRAWAAKHYPAANVGTETAAFNAHWDAKVSAEGNRPIGDWPARWRKWIENTARYGPSKPVAAVPTDLEARRVANIAGGWWARYEGRPVMSGTREDVDRLVLLALRAGASESDITRALLRCGEPVPHPKRFERALLGDAPGGWGGPPRPSNLSPDLGDDAANAAVHEERRRLFG